MKKDWKKPELTVLLRTRPQEVLANDCKTTSGGGPATQFNNCNYEDDQGGPSCIPNPCESLTTS